MIHEGLSLFHCSCDHDQYLYLSEICCSCLQFNICFISAQTEPGFIWLNSRDTQCINVYNQSLTAVWRSTTCTVYTQRALESSTQCESVKKWVDKDTNWNLMSLKAEVWLCLIQREFWSVILQRISHLHTSGHMRAICWQTGAHCPRCYNCAVYYCI